MQGLKDKVAIVTGGGQGIGRALTLRLAREGCRVAIFDLSQEAGEASAALAPEAVIKTYAVDVGDYALVQAAVARVEAELGPIWLLVNNAGWDKPMPFLKTDQALWERIIRINLYGPLNTHHAVLPRMVASGGGGALSTSPRTPRALGRAMRRCIRRARAG